MKNDLHSHGLWKVSAPSPVTTNALTASITADVVIVGAGFTGLSAALHLASHGMRVVVLEAEEIGYGGSGRNVGLVNAGMWAMPDSLRTELGDVYGARLLQLLGDAPNLVFDIVQKYGIECEALQNGTLHCAVGSKGLKEITNRARQWQALGAPVRLLNAQETALKVGTEAYQGSLLDLRAGTIQPMAYVRGLAKAAVECGANIYTDTKVTKLEDSNRQWQLSTASGGNVTAPKVVVATNAYSEKDGLWPQLRTELIHLPYFNLATPPLNSEIREKILPERQGAWDTCQVLSSFRFDAAGRLIFGSVGSLTGHGASIHRNWGKRGMTKLFPELEGIDFEYEWYGMIGMTNNSLPRFHKLERDMYSFSGFNGRGIGPGTTLGRELARLIIGQINEDDLPLPLSPIKPARLSRALESYYEYGSQVAHIFDARF